MKNSKKPRKANYISEAESIKLCADIRQRLTSISLFSDAYYYDNFIAVAECARYDCHYDNFIAVAECARYDWP